MFLKDKQNLLNNAQENKTKALRQIRFETKADSIETTVLAYIKEAIENQHLGREIKPQRKTKALVITDELSAILKSNITLREHFKSLTLAKQREFCNYISEAKGDVTKHKRLDKITPMIIKGIGLHDKYRSC